MMSCAPVASSSMFSQEMSCEYKLRAIENTLELFEARNGRYPSTSEWNVMVQNPPQYGRGNDTFTDPWGRRIQYRFPGKYRLGSFDLWSVGRDGFSSTGGNDSDDVNIWVVDKDWSQIHREALWVRKGRAAVRWILAVGPWVGISFLVFFAWRAEVRVFRP